MGCFPWRSSSSFDWVRVVHVSGYIQDFDEPITVREVVGNAKPPTYFLCSTAHLLSFGTQPLRPHTVLERGCIYFLIPHSIFHTDSPSPTDLASLATRLTAIAKRCGRSSSTKSKRIQPVASSGITSFGIGNRSRTSCSVRSWKPILETIEEMSFERREGSVV